MSEAEESSAQRQSRIRREKREAKIKAGGSERLDKITKLSGRTPEMSMLCLSSINAYVCCSDEASSAKRFRIPITNPSCAIPNPANTISIL
jgi:GET complex subunit GET2